MYMGRHEIDKLNPWGALPSRPDYVLREDAPLVRAYNEGEKATQASQVRLDLLPVPFLGSPFRARALILTGAPAWDDGDGFEAGTNDDDDAIAPVEAEYAAQKRRNLTFANREETYPFVCLNPAFAHTRGYAWWNARLKELIEACDEPTGGRGREAVAQGLLSVAFFPYHVKGSYDAYLSAMPSQKYGFGLVSMMRREEAPIVITTMAKEWRLQMPRLKDAAVSRPSATSGVLGRRNLPAGAFERLVEALTEGFEKTPAPSMAVEAVGEEVAA